MWTPPGWYHETCTLDPFTIGVGALSYDGADEKPLHVPATPCAPPSFMDVGEVAEGVMNYMSEYTTKQIPYCQHHTCAELPYKHQAQTTVCTSNAHTPDM